MQRIMQDVQQYLPLLTVSVSSAAHVTPALQALQNRPKALKSGDAHVSQHLAHICDTVFTLSKENATTEEVQQCLANLRQGMMQLDDDAVQKVLHGCNVLHLNLGGAQLGIKAPLDMLQGSLDQFSRQTAATRDQVDGEITDVKRYLASYCGVNVGVLDSIERTRFLEVCFLPQAGMHKPAVYVEFSAGLNH